MKLVPLIQLAFLKERKVSDIFIEHNRVSFLKLYELLKGDEKSNVLEPLELPALRHPSYGALFKRVALFRHPNHYCIKRVLIYHAGRLVSHFKWPEAQLCGIVELQPEVALDLAGTQLRSAQDRMLFEQFMGELRTAKRSCQDS
jgi:hypothetical protein